MKNEEWDGPHFSYLNNMTGFGLLCDYVFVYVYVYVYVQESVEFHVSNIVWLYEPRDDEDWTLKTEEPTMFQRVLSKLNYSGWSMSIMLHFLLF